MFHTILTLSYTIPGIYLFIRIWQMFIGKRYRAPYLLIFAMLFAIYPVSMTMEDNVSFISRILDSVSDYLLPLFLYLFLFVLLADLLLLINLGVKFISREKLRNWSFRNRCFAIIILLTVAVVTGGIINFNTIRISEYAITIPSKGSNIKNLKIAFVSDFHLERGVPEKFVRRYVDKIKQVEPDLLLYGGDIIEGNGENLEMFEELISGIRPEYGVYGVLGNHDRIGQLTDEHFFSRSGIVLLCDSVVMIKGAFSVAGRDEARYRRKSAEEITSEAPVNLPLIVVDHRPTEPEQLSRTNADIVFSGHTHNGQMFPINLHIRTVYELGYGYMKKRNTNFFVSSGIRLWGPPVRTTGKSEILVVTVTLVQPAG